MNAPRLRRVNDIRLWQHGETGRMRWSGRQLDGWQVVPTTYEDTLPDITDEEYAWWFEHSAVVDGVRIGPKFPYSQ